MTEKSYHYRKNRRQKTRWRRIFVAFILILIIIGGIIAYDVYKGRSQKQSGVPKISQLVIDKGPKINIDEPSFSIQLPADWKELSRINSEHEYGITWNATKINEDNRFMTIYVDKIPTTKAFNRLLPVESVGAKLRHGTVSDNCAAFTVGGSFNASQALHAKETLAKSEEVSFYCDLPKVFDNVTGTSSEEGVNTVTVTGEKAGKHKYFFVYTDHNAHPDYEIFTDIIESFRAK